MLHIFLDPEQLHGNNIWINPHYYLIVNKACNGMIPMLFLCASILAYPASFLYKSLWMIIGYLVLFITNTVRILLVVYLVKGGGKENFYWAHDILGNVLLLFVGLVIFIAYIYMPRKY